MIHIHNTVISNKGTFRPPDHPLSTTSDQPHLALPLPATHAYCHATWPTMRHPTGTPANSHILPNHPCTDMHLREARILKLSFHSTRSREPRTAPSPTALLCLEEEIPLQTPTHFHKVAHSVAGEAGGACSGWCGRPRGNKHSSCLFPQNNFQQKGDWLDFTIPWKTKTALRIIPMFFMLFFSTFSCTQYRLH